MGPDPALYLDACDVIDFRCDPIITLAESLADDDPVVTAERCFHFVRDQIRHSGDHQLNPVTCRASDVLAHRTGYCYAKSHLLAALLRACRIPAGLCYQRLSIDGSGPPFCLHGLNAVCLPDVGWYRVDPRGNRDGIDAEFTPPTERLAFTPEVSGEEDLPEIHPAPLPQVTAALRGHATWNSLNENLPDITVT